MSRTPSRRPGSPRPALSVGVTHTQFSINDSAEVTFPAGLVMSAPAVPTGRRLRLPDVTTQLPETR
ncbi:hypothetical protein [Micromonospora sp. SL4-19]|uniref:hypothetical protein n=1 Tax=Micromonospora sp. SL4-19 TaxID=3399129 RepID=UPI003A4DFE0D